MEAKTGGRKQKLTNKEMEQICKEKCTTPILRNLVEIKNFVLPERYLVLKDQIDNYAINEEDIWICCFPKTGNDNT